MTRDERNQIVMSAAQNAVDTVYVEKSEPIERLADMARLSVYDCCESILGSKRAGRVSKLMLSSLQNEAVACAESVPV